MNQFRKKDPQTGTVRDWAKGMSRPDYIAYDLTAQKAYFIIHELSSGSIQNKKSDAMKQLLNMVRFLDESELCKNYCAGFDKRLCYVSATGCVAISPQDMARGFMDAYSLVPDPIPLTNASIERRGFKAFQTNTVKL